MERLKYIPVPLLPTFVGAMTLSNVYAGMGFTWVRHITMIAAIIVWLVYLVKIVLFSQICLNEYTNVVPCSLYAGFFMMLMIIASYLYDYNQTLALVLWFAAWICHAVHIVIFTVRNVILRRDINTFVPSWFVTYNGIMVCCVVGAGFGFNHILKYIVYYGILVYLVIIPFMIWRLATVEVKPAVYHTMAVVLAPCSLCVVSYLNVIENPNKALVIFLYICVLISLAFIIYNLPKFFAFSFVPGYAGVTFPMAIGTVATGKMAAYLANTGSEQISGYLTQLQGIQIYLTTMIIGYVLLQFLILLLRIERR